MKTLHKKNFSDQTNQRKQSQSIKKYQFVALFVSDISHEQLSFIELKMKYKESVSKIKTQDKVLSQKDLCGW